MRRNCTQCGAWRHLVFFMAWSYKPDGTPEGIMGHCESCQRARRRKFHANRRLSTKNKNRVSNRTLKRKQRRERGVPEIGPRVVTTDYREDSVPRMPLARWLSQQVAVLGMEYASNWIDLSPRQIRYLINGYYTDTGKRGSKYRTKRRPIDYVGIRTVDKIATSIGDPSLIDRLYPLTDQQLDQTG